MSLRKSKILAIDPGTREMGIAFFDKGKLIYQGVKTIKDKERAPYQRLKEARKIILRLIRDFKPKVLVSEKTFFAKSKNTALLNVLGEEIKNIAKRKGLKLLTFAPSTVKKYICGNGYAKKKEIAKAMVAKFPELKVYLTQDRQWKERYHQNMFDAVALGLLALKNGKAKDFN
jgi:Holliday junction resolvasome RuvABC endonuclease subunit